MAYPHIARLGRVEGYHEFRNLDRFKELEFWRNILIIRVDAPLTFINSQFFKEYIEKSIQESEHKLEYFVLDAGPVSHLDATASHEPGYLITSLKEQNIQFLI